MIVSLYGQIVTPIISKKPTFSYQGCEVAILSPRRRAFNKLNTIWPMIPYSYVGFLGVIKVTFNCETESQTREKLGRLFRTRYIGRFVTEGMGKVRWDSVIINKTKPTPPKRKSRRIRILRGLPHDLPEDILELVRLALLHDFVHTERHQSKIYVELNISQKDLELLKKHYEEIDDPLIQILQHYDRLASIITRKVKSPKNSRYNWRSMRNIDFNQLADEIEENSRHPWKLYGFVYNSRELDLLNESLEFGHTSLRKHLLMVANLIVRDFNYRGLKIPQTLKFPRTGCLVSVGQSMKGKGSESDRKGVSTVL